LPVGLTSYTHYTEAEVAGPNDFINYYDVDSFAMTAGYPFFLGEKDMVLIGEYFSWSEFDIDRGNRDSFSIATLGIPVAWLRQVDPQWQVAAFVMPFGHYAMIDDDRWTLQTMGGAFARYVQNNNLWWAFGAYLDINRNDSYMLPYVGAYWAINERWVLNAILPWPSIDYAPNKDWFFSLGASPSAASWTVDFEESRSSINLDAWDFGLKAYRRVYQTMWFKAEAGVGGMRALRFYEDGIESASFDVSASSYVSFSLEFRPSVN